VTEEERHLTPEIFDRAFTEAAQSIWLRSVFAESMPDEVDPFSFITLSGLEDIASWLSLSRESLLIDLACGRGGPGLWLARRTGATLTGVDFSPVGVAHARERAARVGLAAKTRYILADAASTGLPAEEADGLVCVDSVQLMTHRIEVMREVYRLLKPGARAIFTTWEESDRLADLRGLFEDSGLTVITIEDRPDWLERERSIFERAQIASVTNDDPGLKSLAEEADRVLPIIDHARRVLGVAQR
jgi:SAM-dependent methyltransferase